MRTADRHDLSTIGTFKLFAKVKGITCFLHDAISSSIPASFTLGVNFSYLFKMKMDFSQDSFHVPSLQIIFGIGSADELNLQQRLQFGACNELI